MIQWSGKALSRGDVDPPQAGSPSPERLKDVAVVAADRTDGQRRQRQEPADVWISCRDVGGAANRRRQGGGSAISGPAR